MRVGINGFGRIGRNAFRASRGKEEIEIVAVNDLTDNATLAHLLKYDSVYGRYPGKVELQGDNLTVDDREIQVFAKEDPLDIPWRELGVEVVIEATGKFRTVESASRHLEAGASWVVVTAPVSKADLTMVMGINHHLFDPDRHHIISNASCTTNALAPVCFVLERSFGIQRGLMNTTHSFTNDQKLLDLPHPDLRRARAATLSVIPTSTGAAKTVSEVIPELKGKIDGFAIRVPTPTVSIVDFVSQVRQRTSIEEVNEAFRQAAEGFLHGVMAFSDEPLVGMDYRGNPHSSIIDGLSTMVIDGELVRVVAWYDNEWGYSNRVIDLAAFIAAKAAPVAGKA